jgi:hypothetical protein
MKYTVEMDSGAMIYIPTSLKIGSDVHELIGMVSQIYSTVMS